MKLGQELLLLMCKSEEEKIKLIFNDIADRCRKEAANHESILTINMEEVFQEYKIPYKCYGAAIEILKADFEKEELKCNVAGLVLQLMWGNI